ncbi:MAG: hypothetical protein M0P61_02805 [Ignavibacteriaceae bacterium]|jgi:hypothetical protein|nr:hypothetical protein [Ignavibacteriaceae bacterium]
MITSIKRIVLFLKETLNSLIYFPQYFSFKETLVNFPLWWKSLNPSHNSLIDASPWISFTVIKFLELYLKPNMKVFEYGSGGSTLFFAKRVEKVVSIEHNKLWFEKVNLYLQELKLKNIDYKLFEPENDSEFHKKNIADPNDYISDDKESIGKNYEKYVKSIEQFPDAYFDVVSIDGRARPSCCKHAISKIKRGGYLVFDNVETKYYAEAIALLMPHEWEVDRYYGLFPFLKHFSMTLLAKKK